ncbi:MAG: hypothetical protein AB1664_24250 [Thermodesulfobacteriota bacterium]
MTKYRLLAEPNADLDVVAAFNWYEKEQAGLGRQFLDELRTTNDRMAEGPPKGPKGWPEKLGGIHLMLRRQQKDLSAYAS